MDYRHSYTSYDPDLPCLAHKSPTCRPQLRDLKKQLREWKKIVLDL